MLAYSFRSSCLWVACSLPGRCGRPAALTMATALRPHSTCKAWAVTAHLHSTALPCRVACVFGIDSSWLCGCLRAGQDHLLNRLTLFAGMGNLGYSLHCPQLKSGDRLAGPGVETIWFSPLVNASTGIGPFCFTCRKPYTALNTTQPMRTRGLLWSSAGGSVAVGRCKRELLRLGAEGRACGRSTVSMFQLPL